MNQKTNLPLWGAASAFVIVLAILASCASPEERVSAFVQDTTASVTPEAQAKALENLNVLVEKVADEHGRVVVWTFAGGPADFNTAFTADLKGDGPSSLYRNLDAQERLKKLKAKVGEGFHPPNVVGGTDVVGALFESTQRMERLATSGSWRLIFDTDGEQIGDGIVLPQADLSTPRAIQQVLDLVAGRGLIPDLKGTKAEIHIVGIGASGEASTSSTRTRQYEQLYQAWCGRTGARRCDVGQQLSSL